MNILIISRADHTGTGYALMQAINAHTEHKARAISYKRTWLEYPHDILHPSIGEFLDWIKWADVLNIHSDFTVPATSKSVVVTYHGSYYRKHRTELNTRDKNHRYKQTCVTLTLSTYGPKWIGRAMPDLSSMHKPNAEFTVSHCATHPKRKGTQYIKQALSGIPLDVVVHRPNAECLQRRARCHVFVERYMNTIGTIGTAAIESMSMGLPVLSWSSKLKLIESTIGYVPFISYSNADELRAIVELLRDDAEFYQQWQEVGWRYVRQWHDPKAVAEKFVRLCSE